MELGTNRRKTAAGSMQKDSRIGDRLLAANCVLSFSPGLSRQRRWQIKKTLGGGCEKCGRERKSFKNYCDRHAVEIRLRNRHLSGSKPWQRGGRGRPPMGVEGRGQNAAHD